MTDGQWRVFGLLIILLILEGIANLNGIRDFFNGLIFNPFKQSLQGPPQTSTQGGSPQAPQTGASTGGA